MWSRGFLAFRTIDGPPAHAGEASLTPHRAAADTVFSVHTWHLSVAQPRALSRAHQAPVRVENASLWPEGISCCTRLGWGSNWKPTCSWAPWLPQWQAGEGALTELPGQAQWPGLRGCLWAPQTQLAVLFVNTGTPAKLDCALSSLRSCIPSLLAWKYTGQRGPRWVRGGTSWPWASLAYPTSSFGETVSGVQYVLGVGWLGLQQESLSQREMCLAGGFRCHLRQAALPQFPLLS